MEGNALERLMVSLSQEVHSNYYGKYRGTVVDIGDGKFLGRIKVKVPSVYQDEISPWALPCLPFAGKNMGFYAVPAVGSGVWVEFEEGKIDRPIWTGGWWADGELPQDEAAAKTDTPKKIIRSEKGMLLVFDDDAKTIALSDGDGKNLLKIKVDEGNLRLQAATKVVVEAPAIELVDGASHPLVFGDDLLSYLNQLVNMFNAHMHPGQTAIGIPVSPAPPVPPFPPATPALLSVKVKTG